MPKKIPESEAIAEFEKYGLIVIGEYKSTHKSVDCETVDGYKICVNLHNLKRDGGYDVFTSRNEYTIYNIKKWLLNNNSKFTLVSDKYVHSQTKLEFYCPDCNAVIKKTFMSLLLNHGCYDCEMGNRKGENNNFWNGGTSELYDRFRKEIVEWKLASAKNCGYKCIVTHGKFDDIHHIHPFRNILDESLLNCGLEDLKLIINYTQDELERLKVECIRLHNVYGYGVCFSKEFHKRFHKMYGVKNNTKEQLVEYLDILRKEGYTIEYSL
jgi:hypothetical protein